jgi:hypothetical protein
MQNIIMALVLTFVAGMVFGLFVVRLHDLRKQKKIENIYLPSFDPNNPMNGGARPEDVIETEEGIALYRIRPQQGV